MPFTSVGDEMHKWKAGQLHSGGPNGPVVTNQKQAIAISLSEARRHGQSVAPKKRGKLGNAAFKPRSRATGGEQFD